MQEATVARYTGLFRVISVTILCAAAFFFVVQSSSWSVQWDTSIMHYVNFLMDHGKAPYRDVIDINMPGSYFIEGWAMRVFGRGDFGWRMYEFFLLGALTASMIVIARPYDWLAGLFAGVLFTLTHGAEGPENAVERDEVMTVLVMAGIAFAFSAIRARKPALMLPFGLLLGLAASLKPTVIPLGPLLLIIAFFALRRRNEAAAPYVVSGISGFIAATLIVAGFFIKYHAFGDFLAISKRLIPYYASVGNHGMSSLVAGLIPRKAMYPLLLITLIFTVKNKDWKNWERQALALVVCFSALSFIAQRKGFIPHRNPLLAFLLLWMALEFTRAMKMLGWMRILGFAAAVGFLCAIPGYCHSIYAANSRAELSDALDRDLKRLGGPALQGQVQCMDLVAGCLNSLYRLNLMQNTGFMGDYMFFGPPGSPPLPYYRDMLLSDFHRDPPRIIVITTEVLSSPGSFDKIAQWPQFVELLNSNYVLDVTRIMSTRDLRGYKIYRLKENQTLTGSVMKPGL